MQVALDHTRQSMEIKEEDEAMLSPLGYGHLNVLGHYSFTLAEQVMKGQLRPLNQNFMNIIVTFRTVGLQTPKTTIKSKFASAAGGG